MRKAALKNVGQSFKHLRRHSTRVVPNVIILRSETELSRAREKLDSSAEDVAKLDFYSLIVINEMIAEYVAILTSSLVMIDWKDKVLFYDVPWYATLDEPFAGEISIRPVLTSVQLQLFTEILVDAICIYYETKRQGLDLGPIWRKTLSKGYISHIMLGTWIGYIYGTAASAIGTKLGGCRIPAGTPETCSRDRLPICEMENSR